jgi:Uma2 family endonuclease
MALANQEAQRFNHEYIGTEHILLGLVKEGGGVGAKVLKNLDIDLRKVRLEVEKLVKSRPDVVTMGKLPQTPRAKKVIEYAIEEIHNLNHKYVGTEHLLLGLLREHDGVAAQVLMNLNLKLEEVREEVIHLLGVGVETQEPAQEKQGQEAKGKTPAPDSFGRDLDEQHYRLGYDRGTLEFMPRSSSHDRAGRLLGRLIHAYTEQRDIPIATFRGTTWRRKDRAKGLEADDRYYVAKEARVRGRDRIDHSSDPPPDLAVEIDITRGALDKQQIYADIGITELWRWEDESLRVLVLGPDGKYVAAQKSLSFPDLPLAEVARFMSMRHGQSETAWIKLFREWVAATFPTQ